MKIDATRFEYFFRLYDYLFKMAFVPSILVPFSNSRPITTKLSSAGDINRGWG